MLGLIDGSAAASFDQDPMKVDYGLVVGGQSLMLYEKGVCKGTFGYKPGDRLAVAVLEGMVTYRKTGTVLRQTPPTPNVPLHVVALFQGKGAKATKLTTVQEVINYEEKNIPMEYNGQARGNAIKEVLTEYERPFTIVVQRPPAASILERAAQWANDTYDTFVDATDGPKTEEERKLRENQAEKTSLDSEMAALQEFVSILIPHQKCWSWWVDKLKGSGSNIGVLSLIQQEINENGQKLQDGRLPSLEHMGYKVSPTLAQLSPASQAYNEKAGFHLTCGKQHLHNFKQLWQGNPPQQRPVVLVPDLDKWSHFLEKKIVAGYFPYYFAQVGDLELADLLFRNQSGEGDTPGSDHQAVLQKHERIEAIYREVNEGLHCIATDIGTKGNNAITLKRNFEAWAADVQQVKSKKDKLDDRRKQQNKIDYNKCTGHAVLFPGDDRIGPSNYSEKPQPTLLYYIALIAKSQTKHRESNKINVDKVRAVEEKIRLCTEDKEKKEALLEEKNEKLTKAIRQSEDATSLLIENTAALTLMTKLESKYQGDLDKLSDETTEEEKFLTEKNDQYKAKVAELKQKNIDDLTCGCLYKYIDIATALLYMGITRCLAKALACTAYNSEDPDSEARLIAIPEIECWTGDHRFMAPAAVLGLCALYPTAMLTRPLFQALDEKLEFHFDYDYLFVFSQLQTFLLVASSFFPNTKEVLLSLCLFVDLVLLRFFMSPSSTDGRHNKNYSVFSNVSSNKKTVSTDTIEAYKVGSFLKKGKGGKIVEIKPRKPGDTQGDGTLVLELERRSFLLPQNVETFINRKLIQRRNRRMDLAVAQEQETASTSTVVHHEADSPALNQDYDSTLMVHNPPLLMADREETSMERATAFSIAVQGDDVDGSRRETRTASTVHGNLQSHRTKSIDQLDQGSDQQQTSRQGEQKPDETIRSGACTAQPINKIAIVAFGFSAW
jgi:hypothetical protein